MAWTAEKRLFAALGGVALLVVLLLPFVFRELEPDYQAAYSMDPSKKRRFAEKAAAPVVLPGPAAAAAASSAPPPAAAETSPHRLSAPTGRARADAPPPTAAVSAPGGPGRAGSDPAPRLAPLSNPGAAASGANARTAGSSPAAGLEDARFDAPPAAKTMRLQTVAGAAGTARLAQSLGLKGVGGLALAGGAELDESRECTTVTAELQPKLAAATAEYTSAAAAMKAGSCPADACGRYASDCALKDRSDEEAVLARRRCDCDRRACRKDEACRAAEKLRCEQERACAMGRPVSCSSTCG